MMSKEDATVIVEDLMRWLEANGKQIDADALKSLFSDMVKEAAAVNENSNPVCPICKSEMQKVNFNGYYDRFSYWECSCENFPGGRECSGAYA